MKKHIIYLNIIGLLSIFHFTVYAQSNALNLTAFHSSMKTGFLADKNPFSAKLKPFTPSETSDTCTHERFYDAVLLFNKLSVSDSFDLLIEDIQDRIVKYQQNGISPLAILDYAYESIRPDYITQDVLGFNSNSDSLYPLIPVPNLFRIDTAILVHTPIDIYRRSHTFLIPSDLYFTNLNKMRRFEVDFADGKGFRPVMLDTPVSVLYPQIEGEYEFKTITIRHVERIDRHNGTPRSYVKTLHKSEILPDIRSASSAIPELTCLPGDPVFADALVQVRYGKKNAAQQQLRHPVVFIEGFDLDSDPNDDRFGSVTWHTLMTGLSFDENGRRVRPNLRDLKYLASDLYEYNYDLVFIDFKDASADLFANGNTVIRILKWLESQKVGNDGISVIGASMGGIVARYAIRQMELTECGHCVKLYGTFDSPHRGANIPLGLQHAVDFLSDVSSTARFGKDALKRIGAMQQMHYSIVPDARKYFKEWNDWHDKYGQPRFCRRIAVTNSSPVGKNAPFLPGGVFYEYKHSFAGTLMSEIELSAVKNCQGISNCEGKVFKGLLPVGSSGVSKFLNMYFGTSYNTRTAYASSTLPLDNIAGSFSDWVGILHSAINQYLIEDDPMGSSSFLYSPENETTFITAASSLDMEYSNLSPNLQELCPDRLTSSIHPFDAIFYHGNPGFENQLHVKLEKGTGRNIEWIIEQLEQVKLLHPSSLPISSDLKEFNLKGNGRSGMIGKVTIDSEGVLKLNERGPHGFAIDENNTGDNWLRSTFKTYGCDAHIMIKEGGLLQVGEKEYEYPMSLRSDLEIRHGAILEIQNGGTLHINDGSSVIIDEMSHLVIHPGANIILDGLRSLLILKGEVVLRNGAKFTVVGADKIGEVQLHGSGLFFNPETGKGGTVAFSGSEKAGDLQLKIYSVVEFPSSLTETRFERVDVNFMEDSKILAKAGLHAYLADFDNDDGKSNGILFNSTGKVFIKSCTFEGFNKAFTGLSEPASTVIENCVFKNNDIGFAFEWSGAELVSNSFMSNRIGAQALSINNLIIQSSRFAENEFAIFLQSANTSSETGLFNCYLAKNKTGLYTYGSNLYLGCNLFEENDVAIDLVEGEAVSIGSGSFKNQQLGSNTFANNVRSIRLNSGSLEIKDGGNNFIHEVLNKDLRFITGSIGLNCTCLDVDNFINASGNFWSPSISSKGLQFSSEHYELIVRSTPHPSAVHLKGNSIDNFNSSCTDFRFEQDENKSGKRSQSLEPRFINATPNPSTGRLRLLHSDKLVGPARIKLIDLQGVIVFEVSLELTPEVSEIRVPNHVSSGLYSLVIDTSNSVHQQKLIIQ